MADHVSAQKKRSIGLDEIIEHVTADVHNSDGQYIQLGFTPPPTPSSQHSWSEYSSVPNNSNPHMRPFISHSSMMPGTGDAPVYFTDIPVHYDVPSHLTKPNEIQQHNYFYTQPRQQMSILNENHELIGTMVDGGGHVLNVVYGGRPGGNSSNIIPQSYHVIPQESSGETVTHTLGGFLPYQSGVGDNSSNPMKDYGLFRGNDLQIQPRQMQQQHFQTVSNNHGQLIENLVGNWVPNQSGTYSPFGCTDSAVRSAPSTNQQTTQTSHDHMENENELKGINRSRKQRIVAEVHPMRPSYSDVLAKSAPLPPTTKNSHSSSTSSVKQDTVITTGGKVKSSQSSKGSNKKSKNLLLKRQHSSGSDEHNNNSSLTKTYQSPKSTRKSTGSESKFSTPISFNSLPRKWVSLDDLDSDKQINSKLDEEDEDDDDDEEEVFQSDDNDSKSSMSKTSNSTEASTSKKSSSSSKSKSNQQNDDKWEGSGATLNNHKPPAYINANKGSGASGSGAKRPIHINNNLSSSWTGTSSQASVAGEKNMVKGSNNSAKNCKANTDDKKGVSGQSNKTEGKGNTAQVSNGRTGGRSSVHSLNGVSEKPAPNKRNQRKNKKPCHSPIGLMCQPLKHYVTHWGQIAIQVLFWFMHLLSDVLGMSTRLLVHLFALVWARVYVMCIRAWHKSSNLLRKLSLWDKIGFKWKWGKDAKKERATHGDDLKGGFPRSLENNIPMPATGEEAMKRLLACKGKDPYSILGVTPHSTDDDIKKYYKRQAFLVHPDKNNQPGAEEAFKILVHAFELIGEPERRKAYDRRVAETQQVEQAWSELSDLLSQLHQKMEYAANTIRCTNCGKRHQRLSVNRPIYAARMCSQCKIHHAAREGDIWAESSMLGFLWHYYACMDGAIYDITEWASCQADNLRHLRADSHMVQYRIVLGKQQQQQASRRQRPPPDSNSEPDLEDFLNNLYSQSGGSNESGGNRADQGRNRRKSKRKK